MNIHTHTHTHTLIWSEIDIKQQRIEAYINNGLCVRQITKVLRGVETDEVRRDSTLGIIVIIC